MFLPLFIALIIQSGNTAQRDVLIFCNDSASEYCSMQEELLRVDSAGIQERDMAIRIIEKSPDNLWVFRKWRVTHDFEVLLIGKDGTEKLRSTTPVKLETLFDLIDTMPMRKAEMRRRG